MEKAKKFLGEGWKFPISTGDDYKIDSSKYEDDIRESIWIILGTAKGERVMRPDFGCGIHDYVFASLNFTTITFIETTVREALSYWEPRIEVNDVTAKPEEGHIGRLLINIDYTVRTTNNQFNLVYPFYLTEGE